MQEALTIWIKEGNNNKQTGKVIVDTNETNAILQIQKKINEFQQIAKKIINKTKYIQSQKLKITKEINSVFESLRNRLNEREKYLLNQLQQIIDEKSKTINKTKQNLQKHLMQSKQVHNT